MFLNKIVIFRQSVEIYVNLIPFSLLGGIDISITPQDFLPQIPEINLENGENTPETEENTPINIEKDGIDPSLTTIPLHSDTLNGSPSWI